MSIDNPGQGDVENGAAKRREDMERVRSTHSRFRMIGAAFLLTSLLIAACSDGSNQNGTTNANNSVTTPAERATTPVEATPTPSATKTPIKPTLTPSPAETPPQPTPTLKGTPKGTPTPGPAPRSKYSKKPVMRDGPKPGERAPGL